MNKKNNAKESTQALVLNALSSDREHYVSGEELARQADVSRSAVWKVVNSLRNKGYKIEASPKRGYKLLPNDDVISEAKIKKYMHMFASEVSVRSFDIVDSTNTVAKDLAEKGVSQFTAVVAEGQTKGRGRMGHSFYSPSGTGIYMSIILRPTFSVEKALYITTAAAAACAEAIESAFGLKTEIKWVNDVLCSGKKVCGILTEGVFNTQNTFSYAVLGIGVNVFPPRGGFPAEIDKIASHLTDQPIHEQRSRLAAEILERFIFYYKDLESKPFMKSYRRRLAFVGEKIDVISGEKKRPATLLGLSDNLELEVLFDDGAKELISSGEISIKKS